MSRWEFPEYPRNWDEIKREILIRDGFTCQKCGAKGVPLHVDHIVSLSQGGNNDPENLRTLCEECHKEKHPHLRTSDQLHIPQYDYAFCYRCEKAFPHIITRRTKFCPFCNSYLLTRPLRTADFSLVNKIPQLVIHRMYWSDREKEITVAQRGTEVIANISIEADGLVFDNVVLQIKQDNILLPDTTVAKEVFPLSLLPNEMKDLSLAFIAKHHFYSRGYFIKLIFGKHAHQMGNNFPPKLKII